MKAAPAAAAEATVAEDIHFDFDKALLNPASKGELDKLANYMKENSDATVVIEGNCDEKGHRRIQPGPGAETCGKR